MQTVQTHATSVANIGVRLGIAVLLTATTGCASGRLLAESHMLNVGSGTAAQVFVLRKSQIPGAAVTVPLEIDGTTVAELGSGEYAQLPIAPGPHIVSIAISGREQTERLRAEPGGRYFFQFHFEVMTTNSNDVLRRLDSSEGEREITSGKYSRLSE
jgi:hypothetical protein